MRRLALVGPMGLVMACTGGFTLPGLGGSSSSSGGAAQGTVSGTGQVTADGQTRDFHVDPDTSHLMILVKKGSGASCSLFHSHAIAALATNYTFTLNKADAAHSSLKAEVAASGLDPDQDSYRSAFHELDGTASVPENERADIRTNTLDQLDASNHPILTFSAHDISSLDGPVTAQVDVDVRGQQSTITLTGTASWNGDRVTLDGTGTLDGTKHGMPTGAFASCIDASMGLLLHLELVVGAGAQQNYDASVQQFVPKDFPDSAACGTVGFQTRDATTHRTVEQAVKVACGTCHGAPQQYAATVPLITWQDFHKDSSLAPNKPLFQNSLERLDEMGSRKMPPAPYALAPSEDALIRSWLAGGAFQFACDASNMPIAAVQEPPANGTCETGTHWTRGNHESELMHPGGDCVSCHTALGEGPSLKIAGTVFTGLHDNLDCNGVSPTAAADLEVIVTDANGTDHTMVVNTAGNFLWGWRAPQTGAIPFPYTARVRNKVTGRERHMVGAQTQGSCNACHSDIGEPGNGNTLNPPWGRILPPD